MPEGNHPPPRRLASATQAPLLVRASMARPNDYLRTVRRAGTVGIQAQAGLHAGDTAVGVDVPLLVGLAVAVPDDHLRAVARPLPVGVEALVAVHLQLLAGGVGPALRGAARAVPQLHLGAVGRRAVRHVDAPAGLAAHDLDVLLGAGGRRGVAGDGDVGQHGVLGGVGGVAGGHDAFVEGAGGADAVVAAGAED